MDGLTFIRELHKKPQYKHIPFIIESAGSDYKTEAIESGAALYLMLPDAADNLLGAVADTLARK